MLLDLVEEVVPATNEATLVLVVDQVQFIGHPSLSHLDRGREGGGGEGEGGREGERDGGGGEGRGGREGGTELGRERGREGRRE